MRIFENGVVRHLNPAKDTKSVYFSKDRLMELFNVNPGSDGLKIFFGVHDEAIYASREPVRYQNKVMVVLSTTTGTLDNLNENNQVEIAGSLDSGEGLDNGKLCPPDPNC
jgi:hypothetical protein